MFVQCFKFLDMTEMCTRALTLCEAINLDSLFAIFFTTHGAKFTILAFDDSYHCFCLSRTSLLYCFAIDVEFSTVPALPRYCTSSVLRLCNKEEAP
jgi:hypothetical protein